MRLPTKDEFERLCECYSRFDKVLKGRWFFDKETGEESFFPCEGYFSDANYNFGEYGYYMSSTYDDSRFAYELFFGDTDVFTYDGARHFGRSVRLVSDEPFEGAVHMAGLYWKPTNEEGYYTYDEAMEKF